MTSRRNFLIGLAASMLSASALAQGYPNKPIRLVVPYAAGGVSDIMGRALAQKLGELIGQPMIVENRAGAAGALGTDATAKSPPDGYTIVLSSLTAYAIAPNMNKSVTYDPVKDFSAIGGVAIAPNILTVNASAPFNTLKELVAYAKANPGKVNYASAGKASPGHLTAEYFARHAGVQMTHVPYKGNAEAIRSVLAGETHVMFTPTTGALAHVQGGRARAIGVYLTDRIAELPNVPSLDAQGIAGFDQKNLPFWYGVLVPTGTPREVIQRLNAEMLRILKDPEASQRMRAARIFPTGSTPEEFGALIRDSYAAWGKVIRETGVKGE
jgi:tripartite-type tricarboxylate transporter receptor subunit TctC